MPSRPILILPTLVLNMVISFFEEVAQTMSPPFFSKLLIMRFVYFSFFALLFLFLPSLFDPSFPERSYRPFDKTAHGGSFENFPLKRILQNISGHCSGYFILFSFLFSFFSFSHSLPFSTTKQMSSVDICKIMCKYLKIKEGQEVPLPLLLLLHPPPHPLSPFFPIELCPLFNRSKRKCCFYVQ